MAQQTMEGAVVAAVVPAALVAAVRREEILPAVVRQVTILPAVAHQAETHRVAVRLEYLRAVQELLLQKSVTE
jgi:hypothetical protein